MTTIDHAAEARKLEENAWARGGIDGDALIRRPEERRDIIASAQVHATLALAEAQREANEHQRIANLIAYVRLLETQYAAAKQNSEDFDWSTHQASLDRHKAALGAIREGLGL